MRHWLIVNCERSAHSAACFDMGGADASQMVGAKKFKMSDSGFVVRAPDVHVALLPLHAKPSGKAFYNPLGREAATTGVGGSEQTQQGGRGRQHYDGADRFVQRAPEGG
eukprot:CAMPEP_0117544144 /NCGR_PEP_ID=MMETSP0784-20121206/45421_1 /TAXON_ID=39447 /ORGANISM="" /LENGTH=108 /DNA_ID=CAMNT_0005340937 /DNA_START=16 /DNA_END=341 /DNA_ORIENTATION=+